MEHIDHFLHSLLEGMNAAEEVHSDICDHRTHVVVDLLKIVCTLKCDAESIVYALLVFSKSSQLVQINIK